MNNYSVKTAIPFPIFDVYHFRWNPFCRTSIHDHAKERIYDKELNFIKENNYKAPNISFINNKKGYHSVKSDGWSTSINFYYPKGHKTTSYKKIKLYI